MFYLIEITILTLWYCETLQGYNENIVRQKAEQLDNSSLLDVHNWSNHPCVKELTELIYGLIKRRTDVPMSRAIWLNLEPWE